MHINIWTNLVACTELNTTTFLVLLTGLITPALPASAAGWVPLPSSAASMALTTCFATKAKPVKLVATVLLMVFSPSQCDDVIRRAHVSRSRGLPHREGTDGLRRPPSDHQCPRADSWLLRGVFRTGPLCGEDPPIRMLLRTRARQGLRIRAPTPAQARCRNLVSIHQLGGM